MARDLGTKYVCFKCGTKFYDLKKPVPACPKCGTDQREAPSAKPAGRGSRAAPPRPVEPEEPAAAAADDDEAEAEDEDEAAEADED
jgi:uncharacterized protein (TIGR02300 family)